MKKTEIIKIGRGVLEIESGAISALIPRLGENFSKAVDLLAENKSRIIVTGMGKSGLIGRKIAATLASCGTPALFIHPAEAGHGDLGMILATDVVLVISYSGETKEIIGLLEFIKRIGVKLILITGNRRSRIAKYSDIVLDAKVEREAGPEDMVPTASSTAALALGDALAIALMKKKGFSEEDFVLFHPKGHIGRKLTRVGMLMHKGAKIPRVLPATPMLQVIEEMTSKKLGVTCVVAEDGILSGVITDGDLRRMMESETSPLGLTAGQAMRSRGITISPEALASEALRVLEQRRITAVVVTDEQRTVLGVLHLHDLWGVGLF